MAATKFAGPCTKCHQPEPSGYYKKQMCHNCYRKVRRRARGLKQGGFPAKTGPCPVCGRTDLRMVKGTCANCYHRIEQRGGNVTPKTRYTGPCLACGKMNAIPYSRKLCSMCYKRKQVAQKPKKVIPPIPHCTDCGVEVSRLTKTGRCQKCQYKFRYDHDEVYRLRMIRRSRQYRTSSVGTTFFAERQRKKRSAQFGTEHLLTHEDWLAILDCYNYRCAYCDKELTESSDTTQDHVKPLIKGGTHTVDNVVPSCRSCNARKGNGPPLRPVFTLDQILKPKS